MDPSDLYLVAESTQRRYLGLPSIWEEWRQAVDLSAQRHRLVRLITQRALSHK
jgi:hypothetical protein